MFIAGVFLAHEVNLEEKKKSYVTRPGSFSFRTWLIVVFFGLEADLNYAISSSVEFCFFHL